VATVTFGLLNYTSLADAESTTGWTNFDTLDADFAKENTYAITDALRANGETAYYTAGAAQSASGKHVRMWLVTINKAYMQPESSGGYEFLMYDGSTTEYRTMFGSDTYDGGWVNYVVDCALFTTLTLANVTRWGIRINHSGTAKNLDNTWCDYIRYLDGYYFTGGTSGDEVTLALIAARDIDDGAGTLRGYGVVTEIDGVYYCTGKITIGNSSTTTYFLMDSEVLVFGDNDVGTNFYEIKADGTVANITIADSVIRSATSAANTRFVFDMSNTSVTVSITATVFLYGAAMTFASGQTITGNTFNDCGQITHGGADMTGCIVKNYEGSTGTAALVYNVNADPDGEMDDMTFEKGTATTHAIELGSNTPSSITLRGWTTVGYSASNGVNDSTIYNNSGKAITINVVGGSGYFTYRNGSGASTVISMNPVATTITVKDINTLAVLQNARVLLVASDATGDLPYQESVTQITRSGSTATVSHSVHGMATGDFALIAGANEEEYNGCFEITVTGASTYTYTVPGAPSSPATGTIISTGGVFNTLTNASGIVTDSRTWYNDQPFTGRVRLSTGTTFYKNSPIADTIDTANGFSTTVYLIPDD
jgi:hypothetical protein